MDFTRKRKPNPGTEWTDREKERRALGKMRGESILSPASWGIPTQEKTDETKHKWGEIRRYKTMNTENMILYPVELVAPVQGWYPSRWANFVLGTGVDAYWIMSIIPEEWNPSVWKNKRHRRTIRVPQNWKEYVKKLFYRNALWYDPSINVWRMRRRFAKIHARRDAYKKKQEAKKNAEAVSKAKQGD